LPENNISNINILKIYHSARLSPLTRHSTPRP
jgi:hypothetical protein